MGPDVTAGFGLPVPVVPAGFWCNCGCLTYKSCDQGAGQVRQHCPMDCWESAGPGCVPMEQKGAVCLYLSLSIPWRCPWPLGLVGEVWQRRWDCWSPVGQPLWDGVPHTGHPHLEHSLWGTPRGILQNRAPCLGQRHGAPCMGHPVWDTLHGTLHVGHTAGVRLGTVSSPWLSPRRSGSRTDEPSGGGRRRWRPVP